MIFTDENGKQYEGVTGGSLLYIKEVEPKKKTIYDLEEGDSYFSSLPCGIVMEKTFTNKNSYYKELLELNNAFLTHEECQLDIEKDKALATIKKYIHDNDMEFEPDWSNDEEKRYEIIYDYYEEEFDIYSCISVKTTTAFHLSSEEHAKQLIKDCDKELKILFQIDVTNDDE